MDLNWRILDWINDLAGNSSPLDHTMEAVARYAVFAIVAIGLWFARRPLAWLDRTVVTRIVPAPLR